MAEDATRSQACWGGPQSSAGTASGRRVHQRPGAAPDVLRLASTARVPRAEWLVGKPEMPVTWARKWLWCWGSSSHDMKGEQVQSQE